MSALVRAELLKIRTTRAWYAYLGVIVLLVGLGVAGEVGSAASSRRSEVDFQVSLVDIASFAALLAIILGITIVTTEFRHGTITPTLLIAPRRERVIGAKAVAALLVSLGFGLLALAVVAVVGLPWLTAVDAEIHLLATDVGTRAVQAVFLVVLWALLGVAIGFLVQSQVAALVGTLIWVFIGEMLLVAVAGLLDIDGVADYLPFQALDAADGTGGDELLSYWPAVAVSVGWIASIGGLGAWRTLRRDIT